MRVLLVIVFTFLLAGCDEELNRKYHTSESTTVMQNVSCTKIDYCYVCGMGMNGEFDCSFKFSPMCPGRQAAEVTYTPLTIDYKSGKHWQGTSESIRPLEDCR